jgi:hypothetical protein
VRGRELNAKHARDTTTRIRRMIADNGWKVLSDIRPDTFVKWRAGLKCSPKTMKEHHLSANAFLNWLVQTDRLMVNPLAKVPHVETRGKQVRPRRAFTEDELQHLFAIARRRRLAYQMVLTRLIFAPILRPFLGDRWILSRSEVTSVSAPAVRNGAP